MDQETVGLALSLAVLAQGGGHTLALLAELTKTRHLRPRVCSKMYPHAGICPGRGGIGWPPRGWLTDERVGVAPHGVRGVACGDVLVAASAWGIS